MPKFRVVGIMLAVVCLLSGCGSSAPRFAASTCADNLPPAAKFACKMNPDATGEEIEEVASTFDSLAKDCPLVADVHRLTGDELADLVEMNVQNSDYAGMYDKMPEIVQDAAENEQQCGRWFAVAADPESFPGDPADFGTD